MMNLVVLAALWLPCRALVVHRGAPSRALPLRATFFDTEGRLERTGAPPHVQALPPCSCSLTDAPRTAGLEDMKLGFSPTSRGDPRGSTPAVDV